MIMGGVYQIRGFTKPADALATLETERPDMIFLDYEMPGTNGLEVLHQLQSRGIDVPVIMCSSDASEDLQAEALRHGAVGYIRKRSDNYFEEIIAAGERFAL